MKKFFTKITSLIASAFSAGMANLSRDSGMGYRLKQGGFVLLARGYGGYAAGTIVELPASTEAALIASGGASSSAGPATAGAVSTTMNSGSVTFAAAAISLVITNPVFTVQSILWAVISQATADGTALYVARVSVANGSATIFLNAAATAAVSVDWAILNPNGSLSNPQ